MRKNRVAEHAATHARRNRAPSTRGFIASASYQLTTDVPGRRHRSRFDRSRHRSGQGTYTRVSPWRSAERIRARVRLSSTSPFRRTTIRMSREPSAARRSGEPFARELGGVSTHDTVKPSRWRRAKHRSRASRRRSSGVHRASETDTEDCAICRMTWSPRNLSSPWNCPS